MTITDHQKENTLIEGTIGNLIEATFTEGIILEVTGTKGTIRLDLQAQEITQKTKNWSIKVRDSVKSEGQ